ncbi:MAG: hypothetical protein LKJ07_04090 [Leuconostoc mesenteroides]|nr:hypothetical protein [Leuconostoc mesenteroides]MCI1877868.1 hypothetical protein [Leuconostoc mesenteroides]MCI1907409.1 hypothetical protein [Leuconostoc mesenteroides]MCI2152150.1 hypothetical protein [Leuconostoc mesenteroides]MCI2168119.1 hypothetical protein [Leuconostoc mesenteroides]
MFAFGGFIISF